MTAHGRRECAFWGESPEERDTFWWGWVSQFLSLPNSSINRSSVYSSAFLSLQDQIFLNPPLSACIQWTDVSSSILCCCLVAQSCPTLCDPMDCSLPGSSVQGISQANILEWVTISFSRGSSGPRDRTQVSCMGRQILYHWATWEVHLFPLHSYKSVH